LTDIKGRGIPGYGWGSWESPTGIFWTEKPVNPGTGTGKTGGERCRANLHPVTKKPGQALDEGNILYSVRGFSPK